MKKKTALAISSPFILWAMGSFISLEVNPIEWSEVGRALFCVLSIFAVGAILTFPTFEDYP